MAAIHEDAEASAGASDVNGARWDSEDLVRRLCWALDIAERAVGRLAAAGYADPDEVGNHLRPEKLIAETAFLLLSASTAGRYPEVERRVRRVAERLTPHARSERMILGICLEPALALDYAEAHICLARLGYPDVRFDAALRRSLGAQAHASRERPPHRVLEQDWLMSGWTGARACRAARSSQAVWNSALGRSIDLLGCTREDVYAFTHALMYVADQDLHPRRLPRPKPVILEEAEAALAWCLDEQDYDLGGEVLLAWPLVRRPWSAGAAFAFRVLAHVEDQAGFLPAPSTRLQRLNALRGDARINYLLATAYHTAYVMGMLCAAVLRFGRTPPSKIPRTLAARGSAHRILPLLDADGMHPHWRGEFDHLRGPEQDAIAGFLLAIALRRKVGRRDIAGLHDVLAMGLSLGLADSPAASQAAELLERLAGAAPELPVAAGRS